MDKHKIQQVDVLDIIFEKRNKLYGAYELRRNYHKRAKKAFTVVVTGAFILAAIPFISAKVKPDAMVEHWVNKEVDLKTLDIEEPIVPVTPETTPDPIDASTMENTVPVIEPTHLVKDEDLPPTDDELRDNNTGLQDHEGTEPSGTIVDEPILNPGAGIGTPSNVIPDLPDDKVYSDLDVPQVPEFPGGEDALMKYLAEHLIYPHKAVADNISGRVVLEFVVDKTGEINGIKILRSKGKELDEEALRVVQQMPKWKAGKMNGHPVNVSFQLPVSFELNEQ